MSGKSGAKRTTPNLTGQKMGLVTVLRELDERTPNGCLAFEVRCECGTVRVLAAHNLLAHPPKSHTGCQRANGTRDKPLPRLPRLTLPNSLDRLNNQ